MSTIMKDMPDGRGFKPRREGANDPLGPNSQIGRKLKEYYIELTTEEIPDRFAELLARLEKAETPPAAKSDKKD